MNDDRAVFSSPQGVKSLTVASMAVAVNGRHDLFSYILSGVIFLPESQGQKHKALQ